MKKKYSQPICGIIELQLCNLMVTSIIEKTSNDVGHDFEAEAKSDLWQFDEDSE